MDQVPRSYYYPSSPLSELEQEQNPEPKQDSKPEQDQMPELENAEPKPETPRVKLPSQSLMQKKGH